MKILSQRDPQWSSTKLGASSLTIGRYGCTTVAMSMLTDYFGKWMSPKQIAEHKDWYTKDGLVNWSALKIPAMSFEKRLHGRNDAEINESLQDPNKAVILQVENYHWVVCLGKDVFGRYRIADPWFGDKATVNRYKIITGSAHFIGNL